MTEKKCPYCFSGMDLRASRCPACRRRIGNIGKDGLAQKYYNVGLLFCIILTFLFVFGLIIAATSSPEEKSSHVFTDQDLKKYKSSSVNIEQNKEIKNKDVPAWKTEFDRIYESTKGVEALSDSALSGSIDKLETLKTTIENTVMDATYKYVNLRQIKLCKDLFIIEKDIRKQRKDAEALRESLINKLKK